jgi:hypothetical protein
MNKNNKINRERASNRITGHLTFGETACKCGCGLGLSEGDLSISIAMLFEAVRAEISLLTGKETPLYVLSGLRCKNHNRKTGGSADSQHLYGRALDIKPPFGLDYESFCEICDKIIGTKGGVGRYKDE